MEKSTTRVGGGYVHSPEKKKAKEPETAVPINFNPEGPMTSEEVHQMQEELNKLRTDSRQLRQRLNKEVEARKKWQEISRTKDEDLSIFKSQVVKLTQEAESEKMAH